MKKISVTIACIGFVAGAALGQGTFFFVNSGARTRIGAADGPLADASILAQMLVGLNTDSLTPVGVPTNHIQGAVFGGTVTVPGIPGNTTAYMQMVAWNGDLWGSSLAGVPPDQIGRTDIVPLVLSFSFDPSFPPRFTQGAIVPIPEPSAWTLAMLGLGATVLSRFIRRHRHPA